MSEGAYWQAVRGRREEALARRILSGIVMLAEQGQRTQDTALFGEILRYIDQNIGKPQPTKPAPPRILGYTGQACSGCANTDRRLFEIDGKPLCMGCRKKKKGPE